MVVAGRADAPSPSQDIVAFIHREPLVVGSDDWHYTELLMEPTSDWLCYTAGNPNRKTHDHRWDLGCIPPRVMPAKVVRAGRADTPTGTGDIDDTLQNEFRSVDSVMGECGFVGVMWAKVLEEKAPLVRIEFPPDCGARGILGLDELRFNRRP